ncbi:pickpocket protein 28-like [Euwallacea fornicatus]|uniref:pickpocket protein 28-like n=1 Tax=Euwallacea fornicatus TaxID=995702 RepID=UPI00338DB721
MVVIACITATIWQDWSEEPFYITSDSNSILMTEVDFPGIAICDINRISKNKALQLAKNLSTFSMNESLETLMHYITSLGNLHDFGISRSEKFELIQELFERYDGGTHWDDVLRRMSNLVVPCEELLKDCTWDSVEHNCSDLFGIRMTESGFCCIFNYVPSTEETDVLGNESRNLLKEPLKFPGTGLERGLAITININRSDYFYTTLATRGSLLKLFLSQDFPDFSSGSMKQIIVQEKQKVFVDITANALITDTDIRWMSVKKRDCKYRDEDTSQVGTYSSSNCFVDCRTQVMKVLCECIPFLQPFEHTDGTSNNRVCNLIDLICLNKHRSKLQRYYPTYGRAEDQDALLLDIDDSLDCSECYPNCEEVSYGINARFFYFDGDEIRQYANSSRVYVFSSNVYANLSRKMVKVTWAQGLCTLGGIISLILGVSAINIVELLVVLTKLMISK